MKKKQYDIWYAYYKFADEPDSGKERPVLVLDSDNMFTLVSEVTSHAVRNNYLGEVEIDEWRKSGLNKPSVIRLNQRLELTDFDFVHRIGRLQPRDIQKVRNEWRRMQ